jgi:hypothetical protein
MEMFQKLISREVLLPFGVSVCFVGIILRGFARGSRRAAALRRQEWLATRSPGEPDPAIKQTGWFEKNLPFIANTTALTGLAIALCALLRA